MAKIIEFTGITKLDLPVQRIFDKALDAGLEGVVVIGYTRDGQFYAASSYADGGTVIWLLEQTKHELMQAAARMTEET